MIEIARPYLLFLGDVAISRYLKTAAGLRDWAPDSCLGECALPGGMSVGLPTLSPAEAAARGARSLVVAVAPSGGAIPDHWLPSLIAAVDAGLDIVAGLHHRLSDIAPLREAAARRGVRLIDVREPPYPIPLATGRKRSGKRLLTVGTDCALGKKYTALCIARAFAARGVDCDFRASGQTGIMIAGSGVPMDAVISDFEAGAAEMLSPDAAPDHWDVIEGQGSLFHPSFAAVSLGLLHGSQPDVIILCHRAGHTHIGDAPDYPTPSLEDAIALNLQLGRLTNPGVRCAGVSIDTSALDDAAATALLNAESDRLALPVADPIRGGALFDRLIDSCLR